MDWDERYRTAAGPMFGAQPNRWLRACVALRAARPACALAIADGDGRNGRWLARRGIATMAMDVSEEATRRAAEADAAAGVAVRRLVGDVATWRPPQDARFGLVALIYLQGPQAQRAAALRLAADSLAPGGWFVMECFGDGPPSPSPDAAGPGREKRYALVEVLAALEGLEVEEATIGLVRLDEGPRHRGLATVVRALARRPG